MVYLIPFYLSDLPFMIDTALAFHLKISPCRMLSLHRAKNNFFVPFIRYVNVSARNSTDFII